MDTLHCEILIIGAGIAGCAAACAAASAGAKVLVLEQSGTITAHGMDVAAIGSRLQREQGVEVDPLEAARLMYAWSQSKANYDLIRIFTDRSGAVMDRCIEIASRRGMTVRLNDTMTARVDWDRLEPRFRQFRTAHTFSTADKQSVVEDKAAIRPFVEVLRQEAEANGARFRFHVTAERLLKKDGRVTGVEAEADGGRIRVRAEKGVILAAGGITQSRELLNRYCPEALRADKNEYFPPKGNDGGAYRMARQAGAAYTRSGAAPVIHPVNFTPLGPGIQTSWLMVNRLGRRFCCEMGFEPIVTNARLNAPGNVAWAVWDSRYPEHVKRQEPGKARYLLDGLEEKVEAAAEAGDYARAATIPELAEAIGVPPEELTAAVERYNGFAAAGEDPDFGVPARFLSSVEKAPFYAAPVSAWLLNVPFGLHVDTACRVLTGRDEVIPGLYAVGNMQGDFFGNSYPVTCPGANHGRSVTFGFLVGEAVAKGASVL